jgi:hypothetical protein
MSHPKGERARLDTLPQRLSGLGSAYVALAMSHEGGKDHLYEQSEKIRYPQLPVSRRPFTHGRRSTAAGFVAMLHALRLVEHPPEAIGPKAGYGI